MLQKLYMFITHNWRPIKPKEEIKNTIRTLNKTKNSYKQL